MHGVLKVLKTYKYIRKRRIANLQTTSMINECRISDVVSVAMDGVAPELRPEGALREERHWCGTACALHAQYFLRQQRISEVQRGMRIAC